MMFPLPGNHVPPPSSLHVILVPVPVDSSYFQTCSSDNATSEYLMKDTKKRGRQTTAAVASSGGRKKRKSTAQPRPALEVPPRGIGPVSVVELNSNDVLSGRGGRVNAHKGNVQFRELVSSRKRDYLDDKTKKLQKAYIAAEIVRQIRTMDPPGRFLKQERDGGCWWDIGDAKAIRKVGQALREDGPVVRKTSNADDDDQETKEKVLTEATASSETNSVINKSL